jgi:hypothetical protein
MKHQVGLAERQCAVIFDKEGGGQRGKGSLQLYALLEDLHLDFLAQERQRATEGKAIQRRLAHMKTAVEDGLEQFTGFRQGVLAVEDFEHCIGEIEELFFNFKSSQREVYEDLAWTERTLEKEVQLFSDVFGGWDNPQSEHFFPKELPPSHARQTTDGEQQSKQQRRQKPPLPTAVLRPASKTAKESGDEGGGESGAAKFQADIARIDAWIEREGGDQGGWHPRDHRTFQRILSKLPLSLEKESGSQGGGSRQQPQRAMEKLEDQCILQIPNINEADVSQHWRWYKKWHEMKRQKRDLLDEWKAEKEAQERRAKAFLSSASCTASFSMFLP